MIVLDEQLLGRNLESEIARWYRGAVCFVTDLRPGTVIKDDAIPDLLRRENQPTFLTIDVRDFWRKVPASRKYCVVCFTLSDPQVGEILPALRALLRHPDFNTKAKRMGKVARVKGRSVRYYTTTRGKMQGFGLSL